MTPADPTGSTGVVSQPSWMEGEPLMWLRKHATPGSASGGFTWDSPEHVVEVPDEVGEELLRIGGFAVAEAPTAQQSGETDNPQDGGAGNGLSDAGATDAEQAPADAEITEAPSAPKRRGGRRPAASTVSE